MIALLSDSHNNVESVRTAVELIRARSVTEVIHCGDIVAPAMLDYFAGLPMHFIFGNNETELDEINLNAQRLGFPPVDDELELVIEGKKCFVYHGTRDIYLVENIVRGGYDFVVHGHTHRMRNERIGTTQVVNPGALYRASTYSIAFVEPKTGDVEFAQLPPAI